tara:strand:+ start:481 stop:687 length:207 start_codon:yes stop_codon:yes gene_type:complete
MNGCYKPGCTDHSVLSAIHWRRACMVRHTLDRNCPPGNSHDAFNHPYIYIILIEHSTLLDMEFEKRAE